jgi:deoxyribonuclease-4
VKQASKRAPMGGLRILIENSAGMGTAVGSRLEEIGEILGGLRGLPVEACLDTAHLFAAGYDIKSEGGLASTIGQIESTIGLENVPVIHANDSKIPLGGHVDRHEHIGRGKIGADAFARILRHPRFGSAAPEGLAGRVFVAETPIDDPGDDRRNVAMLWELAGLKEQAPAAEKGFSMLTAALKKKITIHRKTEKKRKDNAEMQKTWSLAEKTRPRKSTARKTKAKKKRG